MFGDNPAMDWYSIQSQSLYATETGRSAGLMNRLAQMQTLLPPSELPFAERVLVQDVSRENHLIFMRMTVQVTYIGLV